MLSHALVSSIVNGRFSNGSHNHLLFAVDIVVAGHTQNAGRPHDESRKPGSAPPSLPSSSFEHP